MKKTISVMKNGLRHTFMNPNIIFVAAIFVLIYDSGIRKLCENFAKTGNTPGIFEGFVFCTNSWLSLMMFGMGFVILVIDTPASDSEDKFLIMRSGKKAWLFGETLRIIAASAVYTVSFFAMCVIGMLPYVDVSNRWSYYTENFDVLYMDIVPNGSHFIPIEVFRFYLPRTAVLHSMLLLFIGLIDIGMIILMFSLFRIKIVGLLIDIVSILGIIFFNNVKKSMAWFLPYSHTQLSLHNTYVFKKLSFPLSWSYMYLGILFFGLLLVSNAVLGKKEFY